LSKTQTFEVCIIEIKQKTENQESRLKNLKGLIVCKLILQNCKRIVQNNVQNWYSPVNP